MNKNKMTITVGIPAYNEEAGLKLLLKSILEQKQTDFYIEKIIVVSDASSDRTDEVVKSFRDKRIELLVNPSRKGQIYSQNLIFSIAKSDTVVLFEADTIPDGKQFLHKLLEPIYKDKKVGLVQGNIRPLSARSFFSEILDKQVDSHYRFFINDISLTTWFASGRSGRAFSRDVYTQLHWPPAVPEDVYALIWCKQKGIKTVFRKNAVGKYRLPETFKDYLKERQKIHSAELTLDQYFPKKYIFHAYHKPRSFILKPFGYFLFNHPLHFIAYGFLKLWLYKHLVNKSFTDFWPTAQTTKSL